ncbi:UNKNOWN [Stylonychia lemnae]|uniref:Uncharacterized protein n=1 Tax=Stylonychia lemnae TaxID=5949 RepID=A0A078B5D1_STYLE|nr:UNKNOWN [Stylonychia lemnae]|eukprot:CDW89396.1 UNKNOWN [Stylonychia lemnae]
MVESIQNYGEYKLEFKEDEILDDYRFANHKILKFPDIVTHKDGNKQSLFVAQDFMLGKGGICWDAVNILSMLNIYSELCDGKRAATALPSLLIAAYGHKVIASDLKKVIALTQKCLELNQNLNGSIQALELYWGNEEHLQIAQNLLEGQLDYIICADLIYLEETFEDLVKTLKLLSSFKDAQNPPMIFMSYKIRLPELTQRFIDMFKVEFDIVEELNILDIHPNPQEKFIKAKLKQQKIE